MVTVEDWLHLHATMMKNGGMKVMKLLYVYLGILPISSLGNE